MGFPRTTPWAGSSPCSTASSSSSASSVGSRPSIKSRRLRSLPWTARPAALSGSGQRAKSVARGQRLGLGQPRGPGGGHGGREIQRDHGHPQTASDAGTTRGHRDHRCDGLPEGDRRHDTGTQGGLCAGGQRQSRTPGGRRRGVFCRPGRREPTDPATESDDAPVQRTWPGGDALVRRGARAADVAASGGVEGLQSICRATRAWTERGEEKSEVRYFISSLPVDAPTLGKAILGHWGIENGLHWVLDMSFDEDRSRARTEEAPANLAVLRRWIVTLLRQDKTLKDGIDKKRLQAGWNEAVLEQVLGLS